MVKTSAGLIAYARSKLGTPYFYGAKMQVLTPELFAALNKMYPAMIPATDKAKIGQVCCDCSGLISAYTGVLRGSAAYHTAASVVAPIGSIRLAPPGALVWRDGHIGVYVGLESGVPMYIAEDGSTLGCRKSKLPGVFTDWFECPDVVYVEPGAVVLAADGRVANVPARNVAGSFLVCMGDLSNFLGNPEVGVRSQLEAMGYKVAWDADGQVVEAQK